MGIATGTSLRTQRTSLSIQQANCEARFVAEYLVDLNAPQAAMRAGTANEQGARLLVDASVRAALATGTKRQLEKGFSFER